MMCERGQLRITGHYILKDHISLMNLGGTLASVLERRDLRLQEIQLISNILSMDESYGGFPTAGFVSIRL